MTEDGSKIDYYTKWSNTIYFAPCPFIFVDAYNEKKGTVDVKMDKDVEGVTRYEVYLSTKGPEKGFKKVATLKAGKDTVRLKGLNQKKDSYVYVQSVYKINKKSVYKSVPEYVLKISYQAGKPWGNTLHVA